MENKSNVHFNEQLRERTMTMAVGVHGTMQSKKIVSIDRPMVNQLIRSSSSVAANCRSATRARSDAEFYSKICIVVEECEEIQFWLEMLYEGNFLQKDKFIMMHNESTELLKVMASFKKTLSTHLNTKNS